MARSKWFQDRAVASARNMLEMKGYEILGIQPSDYIDIVAKEDDTLVFIAVKSRHEELSNVMPSREEMEQDAGVWIADHKETINCTVRFDFVSLNIVDDDRALIRHHVNVFNNRSYLNDLLEELLEEGEISQTAYDQILTAIA